MAFFRAQVRINVMNVTFSPQRIRDYGVCLYILNVFDHRVYVHAVQQTTIIVNSIALITATSGSSTAAAIQEYSKLGTSAYIFLEHKLPVSGFLVAWQYYMKTGDVCSNTSYAAIIRRAGDEYTMIARTLLMPEDSATAGVKFQFIQDQIIRVQEGDVLAVHTQDGTNSSCGGQIVSGDIAEGTNTLVADFGIDFHLNEKRSFPREANPNLNMASLALKAYVSGM